MMSRDADHAASRDDLALHLASCAACRDDAADPVGRLLAHVSGEMALPSPNFTQAVLARLPQASPQQLVQHAQQRRRRLSLVGLVPVFVLLLVVALGPSFQGLLRGSGLALLAETVRQVAGAVRWPLVLMFGSAVGLLVMFGRVLRLPTPRSSLGAMGLAAALVVACTTALVTTDRANAQRVDTTTAATVTNPITITEATNGSVASVWGDIVVDQPVNGNVASVFGTVTARARVNGSVLVGGGQFVGDPALAQSGVVAELDRLVLASGVPALSQVTASLPALRTMVAIAGTPLLLVLLGLGTLLWPNPLRRASILLAGQPWPSFALGALLVSAGVLLLGPLVALLSWSVVGLLSLPLLLLGLHLPLIVGLSVVGGTLALRMFPHATPTQSLLANAALLVVVILLMLVVPFAGLLVFYLVASAGLGGLLLGTRQGTPA